MRNMAVLHSPAFSYPLPVLVRVLFNLLIFKGKILYYNKYNKTLVNNYIILYIYKIVSSLSICKYAILRQFPPFIPYTDKIITYYQLIFYIRTDGLKFTRY